VVQIAGLVGAASSVSCASSSRRPASVFGMIRFGSGSTSTCRRARRPLWHRQTSLAGQTVLADLRGRILAAPIAPATSLLAKTLKQHNNHGRPVVCATATQLSAK